MVKRCSGTVTSCIGCFIPLHAERKPHIIQRCTRCCFQQGAAGSFFCNLQHHVIQLRNTFQRKSDWVSTVQRRGCSVYRFVISGVYFCHQIIYILKRHIICDAILRDFGKFSDIRQCLSPPSVECSPAGFGWFHSLLPALVPSVRTSLSFG